MALLTTHWWHIKSGLTQPHEDGGVYLAPRSDLRSEPALNDEDIKRLGKLITRVFDALGNGEEPQDIEWAFDGRDFVLLQARPVTTLPDCTFEAIRNQPTVWSNANYRDALPMVLSPLHRQLMKEIIDTIWISAFSDPGYPVPDGIEFSRFFKGRLYCNMSAVYWAHYDCNGTLPRDLTFIWGGHQPEIEIGDQSPFEGEAGLRRQRTAMRSMALIAETAHALIEHFEALGKIVISYGEKYTWLSGAGGLPLGMLMQNLFGTLGPKTPKVINGLMAGGEYGHRAVYELDIINPRWQEDPSYLLDMIRTTMATANLDDLRARQKENNLTRPGRKSPPYFLLTNWREFEKQL